MLPEMAQIGFGGLRHLRLKPVVNRFSYPLFFVRLPMHELTGVAVPGFSIDRFNLLSFHHRDHGEGGDALRWVRDLLQAQGLVADGAIWFTTFPRVLGYVFKPVSFWHCHRADGQLVAVLAEVNNTFGERHVYLLRAGEPAGAFEAQKVFHVSPFFGRQGRYRFGFRVEAGRFCARIDYDDGDGLALATRWWGKLEPLTARSGRRAFWRYPLMTLAVIVRIHLQAVRLLRKRVRLFPKPVPSPIEVTE